ncbi:MAG TPA: hypothetical protein VGI45_16850 [Terracidiphilus sp.]|jgi:hypothetical protein
MISVSNLVVGLIAILILSVGFTFHLGWRHGWAAGFSSGQLSTDEKPQPRVKHILGFIYALGWHKGWDYGLREAMRKNMRGK